MEAYREEGYRTAANSRRPQDTEWDWVQVPAGDRKGAITGGCRGACPTRVEASEYDWV